MACNCDISIGYTINDREFVVIPPFNISSSGIENGYYYYLWIQEFSDIEYEIKLFWNILTERWEIIYVEFPEPEFLIAYLDTNNSCPFNSDIEWIITDEAWIIIETFAENCELPLTEEQECFEILVWNKQCEFAQCVLKYLTLLKFGSASCQMLEQLKNKKRILAILNCYDTRDIPDDTTDYNIFTYQEMKNLLNN